jgi:predicted nuclease with TOPRIM domain
MLQYLLNYDVDPDNIVEIDLEYDLDINDKTILQEQINNVRRSYYDLIKLYDNIQGEYMQAKTELANKLRNYQINFENKNDRIAAISKDLEILNLEEKVEALKESLKTVDNQLTFIKADIKILTNSMYNR